MQVEFSTHPVVFKYIMSRVNAGYGVRRASLNMIVVGLGFVVTRAFAFIVGILVARFSGVLSFGHFTLFTTVFVLASELPNAIDITYIRFSNSRSTNSLMKSYLAINFLVKNLYMGVLIISSIVLWLIASIRLNGESADSLKMVSLACAAGGIYSVFLSVIARYLQQHAYGAVSVLRPLFNFTVLLALAGIVINRGNIDVTLLAKAYVFIGVVFFIVGVRFLYNHMDFEKHNILTLYMKYIQVAGVLVISTLLSLLANRLDVFFLTAYLSTKDLGYYGAALRIIVFVSLVTSMTTTVLTPKAPLAWEGGDEKKKYFTLAAYYFVLQLVVAIALVVGMGPIMNVLFGNNYIGVIFSAKILVMQVLFTALGIPFQLIIQCSSHPRYMLYINIIRLFFGSIILYLLVPEHGVVGAAVGVSLTSLLTVICTIGVSMMLMARVKKSDLVGG